MRILRLAFSLGVALFFTAAVAGERVKSDFDKEYDFTKLRTFGMVHQTRDKDDLLMAKPAIDQSISSNLWGGLRAKDFHGVISSRSDIDIYYYVIGKKKIPMPDMNEYGPIRGRKNLDIDYGLCADRALVIDFVLGSASAELTEPASAPYEVNSSRRLIWRGYACEGAKLKFENDVSRVIEDLIQKFLEDSHWTRP